MNDIWGLFLLAGVVIVVAGALWVLLPAAAWLRVKAGEDRYRQAVQYVGGAVDAAEQMWRSGNLADDERYQWVLARLQERFPTLKEGTLQVLIEGAVWGLKSTTSWLAETNATKSKAGD